MTRAALWLHRLAVRVLLPRSLRDEHAVELQATVAERLRAAPGPLARWLVLLGELVDLVRTAVREWRIVLSGGPSGPTGGRANDRGSIGGWSDVRTSLRSLARRPGLALGVTLTIGLGIGATTTIYGIVDGVILRPLPYEDPDRLVAVGALARSGPADPATGLQPLVQMSSEVYKLYRERARSFTQLAGVDPYNVTVSDEDGLEQQVAGVRVTPELFEVLGAAPTLGRAFTEDEFSIGGSGVAMLSYEYWQSRYGGDPDVIGRALDLSPESGPRPTVVGILPRGFQPPEAFAVAGELPMIYEPLPMADRGPNIFIFFPVNVVGRLLPGISLEQAREEAERLNAEISLELGTRPGPAVPGGAAGIGVNDLHEQTVGETGRTLWIFLGAAALLLVLTAMNAATMFLSRALDRTQELGVRVALGAGRGVVARLLLVEAGALSVLGGLLGVALAYAGIAAFLRFAPTSIPRLDTVAIDARVLAAAAAMTLGTAVAAGLLPALRFASRTPWERLQSTGRSTSEAASRLRAVLVGGQLALAVVLLSGASLLFSSFLQLRAMDPGFDSDGLVVVGTATRGPQRIRVEGSPSRLMAQSWDRVRDALGSVPGVQSVALANALPFQAPTWAPKLFLPGDGPEVVREGIAGYAVSDGYLETLGTDVVAGRGLGPEDGPDAEPVVLVNQAFVRSQLAGRDALGVLVTRTREGLMARGEQVSMRIVGVVEDVVQARVEDGPRPAVYVPYGQAEPPQLGSFWSVVRSDLPPDALSPALRTALAEADRTPRVVEGMESRMAETRATPRFQTFLIGAFAAVAMLLAAAGLHGSLAHTVRRRQRELGVRIALGADRGSVLRMVLAQGLRVAGVGLAIGIAGTLAMSGLLEAFLYGMEPYDPLTLAGVALVLMLVSAAACLAPARRATAVDPVKVLGAE